jgi:hypothetical protein
MIRALIALASGQLMVCTSVIRTAEEASAVRSIFEVSKDTNPHLHGASIGFFRQAKG